MSRIQQIAHIDPEWANQIQLFVSIFPEYQPYEHIASMTRAAVSSGKWWEPKTMFEWCFYYPCVAGVSFAYAIQQFQCIVTFLRSGTWETICADLDDFLGTNNIQPKKKQIYKDVLEWMVQHHTNPDTLTMDHVERLKQEVKGLGDGFIKSMRETFTESDDICQYTDIGFVKGYCMVYQIDRKTANQTQLHKQIQAKADQWTAMGFGRVANSFMFQISRYG